MWDKVKEEVRFVGVTVGLLAFTFLTAFVLSTGIKAVGWWVIEWVCHY